MARVLIVGAGLSGLAAAIEASSQGHHVVVFDKSKRIGGRGTSQHLDGYSFGYGPHLLMKGGPCHGLAKKLSRVNIIHSPLQIHRIETVGGGTVRPVGDVKTAALNKVALKKKDASNPHYNSLSFLSSWSQDCNDERYSSLMKSKLLAVAEGWSGLVGRMAAALDEIGVFAECDLGITSISPGKAELSNGHTVEWDRLILACGYASAKKLLEGFEDNSGRLGLGDVKSTSASYIEVALDNKPMQERQAIVDASQQMAVIDYRNIHAGMGPAGSLISAIASGEEHESPQQRLEALEGFLDSRISGWRSHVVQELKQKKLTIYPYSGRIAFDQFSNQDIYLAGDWVESEHIFADAAVETGRRCGRSLQ